MQWSAALGYNSGAYLGYAFSSNTDSTLYYSYRPAGNAGCAATGSLPAINSSCMQEFQINADGTPFSTPFAQFSYDPRTRPWYTTAKSTGYSAWSPLYISSFTSVTGSSALNLLSFVTPFYDQITGAFSGEAVTAYFASSDSKCYFIF